MTREPELPSSRDPLAGALVAGKYRIVSLLGRGGGGRVYKGIQEPLGRFVAVKVLGPLTDDSFDPEMQVKRFLREATVTSQLTHPNTVVVHDYGALPPELSGGASGGLYLIMEYLEGQTLRQVITKDAPLDPSRAIHIAWQIGASLAEAHDHGVVHRDLKPPNVMLVRRGTDPDFVKVLDFGLVKSLMSDDHDTTRERSLLGSPHYMSPEQAVGEPVDARSDIYSFGSTLYELLVGRAPFRKGNEKELSQVLRAVLTEPPPPFAAVRPDLAIPPSLEALTLRCLAKRAEERPATMQEVLDGLSAVALELPTTLSGRRSPVSRSLQQSPAIVDVATPSQGRPLYPVPTLGRRLPAPKRSWRVPAIAAAGLAAVAGVVALALPRDPPATAPTASAPVAAAEGSSEAGLAPSAPALDPNPPAQWDPGGAAPSVVGAPPGIPRRAADAGSSRERSAHAVTRAPFPDVQLVVESVPSGATVTEGNVVLGKTRLVLPVSRKRLGDLALVVSAPGYDDVVLSTSPSDNDEVVLRATLEASAPTTDAPDKKPTQQKKPPRGDTKPPMDIKLSR